MKKIFLIFSLCLFPISALASIYPGLLYPTGNKFDPIYFKETPQQPAFDFSNYLRIPMGVPASDTFNATMGIIRNLQHLRDQVNQKNFNQVNQNTQDRLNQIERIRQNNLQYCVDNHGEGSFSTADPALNPAPVCVCSSGWHSESLAWEKDWYCVMDGFGNSQGKVSAVSGSTTTSAVNDLVTGVQATSTNVSAQKSSGFWSWFGF